MDPLNLSQITPATPVSSPSQAAAGGAQGDLGFGDLLKQAIQEVNQAQDQAEGEARNLMVGESADMHTAMLAVQKADLSFQMMMAVRSKLIDAYREVMRMQM